MLYRSKCMLCCHRQAALSVISAAAGAQQSSDLSLQADRTTARAGDPRCTCCASWPLQQPPFLPSVCLLDIYCFWISHLWDCLMIL